MGVGVSEKMMRAPSSNFSLMSIGRRLVRWIDMPLDELERPGVVGVLVVMALFADVK